MLMDKKTSQRRRTINLIRTTLCSLTKNQESHISYCQQKNDFGKWQKDIMTLTMKTIYDLFQFPTP